MRWLGKRLGTDSSGTANRRCEAAGRGAKLVDVPSVDSQIGRPGARLVVGPSNRPEICSNSELANRQTETDYEDFIGGILTRLEPPGFGIPNGVALAGLVVLARLASVFRGFGFIVCPFAVRSRSPFRPGCPARESPDGNRV